MVSGKQSLIDIARCIVEDELSRSGSLLNSNSFGEESLLCSALYLRSV